MATSAPPPRLMSAGCSKGLCDWSHPPVFVLCRELWVGCEGGGGARGAGCVKKELQRVRSAQLKLRSQEDRIAELEVGFFGGGGCLCA